MQEKIAAYIDKKPQWKPTLLFLRELIQATELEETIKWGAPTYTIGGKNVLSLMTFKEHMGIWFFQGALLKDKAKKLVNAQEGKTQAMRHFKFTSFEEVKESKALIAKYIDEAIDNQKQGKKVKLAKKTPTPMPKELADFLAANKAVKKQFDQLTPGKQRGYHEYIAEAKQAATKQKRLEKIKPYILEGKGPNAMYQ